MSTNVVSFHYDLWNAAGEKLDSSEGALPLGFIAGRAQIIPTLEEELLKLKVGEKKKIQIAAVDAYGPRDEALVIQVPRSQLPDDGIQVGDEFLPDFEELNADPFTVVELTDEQAVLDGNHPLAGMDLTFDVELVEIREATPEELEHGHAHGPDGHHEDDEE